MGCISSKPSLEAGDQRAIEILPTEILQAIFLEACKQAELEKPLQCNVLHMRTVRWVIGQVSRRWRHVALGFPQMWDQLGLILVGDGYKDAIFRAVEREGPTHFGSKSADILREHLLRAGNAPLTVILHINPVAADIQQAANLLALIGASSDRWKSATMKIENESLSRGFLTQVNGHLSRLEMLKWNSRSFPTGIVMVAPSLHDLRIEGAPEYTHSFLHWKQLQKITLFEPMLDELRVLQRSQLQDLYLHDDYHLQSSSPELKFDHLRVLHCPPSALNAFLDLPALESLILARKVWDSWMPVQTFIERSSHSLQRLDLLGTGYEFHDVDNRSIIAALNKLPGLQQLHIDISRDESLVRYLTVDPESLEPGRVLLPNLQHMAIRLCDGADIDHCIEMIESRCSTAYDLPRLRSIQIGCYDGYRPRLSNSVTMRLGELERRGLKVTFHSVF
ncbi:hypothetical protein C8J56DRAFT_287416 [Mycena floridula]|nr:hypothetical protein C8J56DRAFT_287416 [Mycena floridula]